jgi:hypothetical protein
MEDYTIKEDDSEHWTGGTTLAIIAANHRPGGIESHQDTPFPYVLTVFIFFPAFPAVGSLDKLHVPHFIGITICFLLL